MRKLITAVDPTLLGLLALGLAVIVLYARTIGGYFLADDFAYVSISHSYPSARLPGIFVRDESKEIWGYSLGLLRPIYTLNGIIQERLFHADAGGYRIVSLTLHAINAALVFALAGKVLARRWLAFGAALLFAVHPIHAETLAWIGGQSDLLPTAMFLGAMLSFLAYREHGRLRHAFITTALAVTVVFTKENAVVLPMVLAAYDALHFRKDRWERSGAAIFRYLLPYLALGAVLVLYFACRRVAFAGGAMAGTEGAFATLTQILAPRYLEYLSYLLHPIDVAARAQAVFGASTPRAQLFSVVATLAALLTAAIVLAIKRRQVDIVRSILFFGPAWFLITSAPFLFTHSYPRHVYLVSVGFCVLIVAVADALFARRGRVVSVILVAVMAAAWSVATVKATTPWVDTGIISKNMHRTIRRLSSKPEGSVLLLDLPGAIRGAHLFHWSSPFLLGAPFCATPLNERFIVLEAPTSYYNQGAWPQRAAIDRIADVDLSTSVYLVVYDEGKGGRSRRLDTARVREAAQALRANLAKDPERPLHAKWREFIDAAR